MPETIRSLEPPRFAAFRCLGADCEDTCCDGWAVQIDRPTFEKYQQHPDPEWRSTFQKLITLNTTNSSDHDYARIQLATTTCPFLKEGLCAIHKNLGEEYLSVTCASFPRLWNLVDVVPEASLDIGCPEAARVTLLNPEPMVLEETFRDDVHATRYRSSAISTTGGDRPGKPDGHFHPVRRFTIDLLQNRTIPLWKRLLILGFFCDKVQELAVAGMAPQIGDLIQSYKDAVSSSLFDPTLDGLSPQLPLRIEAVVEMILARITSDFTNRRFLSCYKQFMEGLSWGPNSSLDAVCARYQEARSRYAAPFLSRHEYILENYLVNYVYRTLFPFGPQESTYKLREQTPERSIHAEFLLLAAYFSIIETLLVGVAGFHQEAFGQAEIIQVIYTFARSFEHSAAFPEQILKLLVDKRLNDPAGVAVLLKS